MKEKKDTLGLKYRHYSTIYNYDDEAVGKLLKYLMWENGKEIILEDVPNLTKKRIEKRSEELEKEIEKLIENDIVFEGIFNQMSQQIKQSHRCWEQLKENIENKKDNPPPTGTGAGAGATGILATAATGTQTTQATATKTQTTEADKIGTDFCIESDDEVLYYIDTKEYLEGFGRNELEVTRYILEHKDKYDSPIGYSIDDVLIDMDNEDKTKNTNK